MQVFKKATLSLIILSLVILPGFGCAGGSKEAKQALKPVTLTYWRVFEGKDAFDEIIQKYNAIHPNVRIDYRKLRYDEYQDELLHAFAENRGPDMFSVHNTWMKSFLPLIEPMPSSIETAYKETKGTLKKEEIVVLKDEPTITPQELANEYADVVQDYVIYPVTTEDKTRNKIHGIPLSVDTLALYYNQDILDAAGIPEPPTTWQDLQEAVVPLTKYNANGDIAQSGAAIGTGANIERSPDILSLIMMQSNTIMTDAKGQARFAETPTGNRTSPAQNALRFYTDFSNPTKETYTWDKSFPNSFDAFASGQTAFFFGYAYHRQLLDARSTKLDYKIAPMLQINEDSRSETNFANFWIETVSKKSKNKDWAWDFIQFAADEQNVESYLNKTKKPTALRSLILKQRDNYKISVFVDQVLSSKAWYNGKDAITADKAIEKMIDNVVEGDTGIQEALEIAQQKINRTL